MLKNFEAKIWEQKTEVVNHKVIIEIVIPYT